MKLDYQAIESKWKKIWAETKLYQVTEDSSRPKYYVLDMFPYPSGAGLHVGHPLGYVASDIYSRHKRMLGYNVLHPMGYDAFGLPAEQYALDTGVHPAVSTSENITRYRAQLDNIGFSFDWSRQVRTDDPSYYKWTQWIFLQLYHHYYDKATQKARPIADLIEHFEASGSTGIHAAATPHVPFNASAWKAMTADEKQSVLMNYRLAFRKTGYVNWCEALGTVLANDEVKDGVSERGGHPVVQKEMMQWSLRVTAYADRLLSGMENIQWSESLKTIQRNWIGRSEGAYIDFELDLPTKEKVKVFTTRPDTIFGCAFVVLANDHDLVPFLITSQQRDAVDQHLKASGQTSKTAQKTTAGVWTGSYAFHPITNARIPVWIADYVLKDYGTGAIMAVPGDDERDLAFAQSHQLPILPIIERSGVAGAEIGDRQGVMVNSSFLDGMSVDQAITKMLDYLEEHQFGTRHIAYKLRDANFSRQRYWGEPFPITYNDEGLIHALNSSDLPLELPDLDDFKPSPDGRSPLARLDAWAKPAQGVYRETDTMPGYAGSSWYFLRYMDPHNPKEFAAKDALQYWQDVDLYVGGVEHAVGHLMYSRFWHKFLYDLGYVPTEEPFKKLINQGMIQGIIESLLMLKDRTDGQIHFVSADVAAARNIPDEALASIPVHISFVSAYGQPNSHLDATGLASFIQWRSEFANAVFECADGIYRAPDFTNAVFYTQSEVGKMSKRYHNVVNPDDVIEKYGADCFRMYEMFLGPIEQSKPWDTMGIEGISKFLRKLWSLYYDDQGQWLVTDDDPKEGSMKILHATIKKTGEDIERFSFNTAISQFMICVNELRKTDERSKAVLQPLVQLIAPFAPFISEELWHRIAGSGSVHTSAFPGFDEKWLVSSTITYPVCVNGKRRAEITLPAGTSNEVLEKSAMEMPDITKWLEGQSIKKVVIVPGKMVNIVL
jgi:leucyl-tRNA synthetase